MNRSISYEVMAVILLSLNLIVWLALIPAAVITG